MDFIFQFSLSVQDEIELRWKNIETNLALKRRSEKQVFTQLVLLALVETYVIPFCATVSYLLFVVDTVKCLCLGV